MSQSQLILPAGVLVFLLCWGLRAPEAPAASARLPISRGMDQSLRVPVGGDGVPAAELAAWVIEPPAGTPIRGTVVFLHGFMTSHHTVANAGEALRKAGYRAVLVDMRGFGESTGTHRDFGVTDMRDIEQLIDALEQRGLCAPAVGVYGTSLGAAVALLVAGDDRRVRTVVAVAPFAEIRAEVPSFARGVLGSLVAGVPDDALNQVGNLVGAAAKWDLDTARPIDAIQKTQAPILLIHGDADDFIPHAASEQLHAAAKDHSQLVTVPGRGHVDLCFDLHGELQGMTRQWFDEHLMPR